MRCFLKAGDFVHVQLIDPSERLWGRLDELNPAGVTMRCIDVSQLEVFKFQFKTERKVYPQTVFFPMRRVQKVDLDESMDHVPSVIQSIKDITGLDEDAIMA